MSYLLCTQNENKTFCITANVNDKKFELIELKSQSDLNKVWCTPHKSSALNILRWINENDSELATKKLEIQEESRHRK